MPHVISRLHMTRFNRVPLVFGLALQLIQGMLAAGEIIPAERRINWDPGIPGGIPNRTNIFANVKNAPYNAKGDRVRGVEAGLRQRRRIGGRHERYSKRDQRLSLQSGRFHPGWHL